MTQGIVLTRSLSSVANLNNATGTLPPANGGTGLTSLGGPNTILGINAAGTAYEFKTLVAGSGITINYAPGQITFTATGSGSGTVTSVDVSGGSTGLTFSGGPVTTAGVITMSGTLGITHGGTGATTATTAFNNLSPLTTTGDILYFNGVNARLPVGLAGQVLTVVGGIPTWQTTSSALQLYAENPVAPIAPVASGTNSIALLSGSHANAQDSLAIGVQSVSRIQGGVVQASGRFASSGDAQTGRYLLRTNTINNVPTTMFVDGTAGSITLTMPDTSTWTFRVTITGHRTDVNDGHAGYEFKGVIYRNAGAATTAILGRMSKTILAESNTPWDANVFADTANGGFTVTVTGQTSKTIRWLALVETVEITN